MKNFFLYFLIFFSLKLSSQVTQDYYLNPDVEYDKNIPTPESILGHEVGEWHVSHDKLIQYMNLLALNSDRITIENRGRTFEGRPIILLKITDPENHLKIDSIRKTHIKLSEPGSENINISELPIIVYQGFSIHGNEPSGANAGILIAYHLAASNDSMTKQVLKNMVILFDPSYNPDGLQRFSQWANSNRNMLLNPDSQDREYNENWPRGRTNHYWFDLNRDWLPVQLPESRARIKTFTEWLPNILTDHHEMGTNSSFFFQPGIKSRVHPLTPIMNQKLTKKIGAYHAEALNIIGSLYYSEENFDDFYYGKGSTYPDVNGGIGILFEQASSRGHIQESENGILTFPFTIRNQLTAAFSTIKAAFEMRIEILTYFRKFYDDARILANKEKSKSIIFGAPKDPTTTFHLAEILNLHDIGFNKLKKSVNRNGFKYSPENSYVIPLNQKKYRLIHAMFDKQTKFKDSLFYDISAWTFPLAFNVNYNFENSLGVLGEKVLKLNFPEGVLDQKSEYAYLFQGNSYYTPRAIYSLMEKGIRIKISLKPFKLNDISFDYGTYLIQVKNQKLNSDELFNKIKNIAKNNGINIYGVSTGLTEGIDLGSREFKTLHKPKIALVVGDGVRSYDAGEIWHLFDTKYEIPITKIDVRNINRFDLSKYSHIILPSYTGNKINTNKIKNYLQNGGNLIAYRSSIEWLDKNELVKVDFIKNELKSPNINFDQRSAHFGAQLISGSIFNTKLDRSHPINFGINNSSIPFFRNSTIFLSPEVKSFNNPIEYSEKPLMSGYISNKNYKILKKSVPFKIKKVGKGSVIMFTDNTQFRAFWYGTNRLLANSIFNIDFM
ncbi:MAG: zinc carboxypeptidase [Flavobacteriaceae bacterium]|nr:zinc carboxypeptidase [Flavobacteriaceae bacterium]|tara:strand:- start:22943 stop:25450 length:2508 start_codon:yes stop_codon:yes gene_type:complete